MSVILDERIATPECSECGFASRDLGLLSNHNCDITLNGGRCEDYPCCGHESGDCNGLLYGSDEAIKEYVYAHPYCDHENGIWECANAYDDEPDNYDIEWN